MKQYLKPGFSIIELVIGIMISSVLITISLTIYNQINKSCNKIQNITSQDLSMMILQKRMSDDLLGLCPLWFTQEDIKQSTQPKNIAPNTDSTKNNNYFYAQTTDEQLDFMTFVSTNTLQAYPEPEHYIARIVYVLKKDLQKENFFTLQRKEETQISQEFNIEKIKEGKFYTIVENIKKCKLEYGFIEKPEDQKEQNVSKEWKFKWVQQWSEQQNKEKKDQKEKAPNLPDIIRITITLQEFTYQAETIHTFYCMLPQSKNISLTSLAKKRNEKEAATRRSMADNTNNIKSNVEGRKAQDTALRSSHA